MYVCLIIKHTFPCHESDIQTFHVGRKIRSSNKKIIVIKNGMKNAVTSFILSTAVTVYESSFIRMFFSFSFRGLYSYSWIFFVNNWCRLFLLKFNENSEWRWKHLKEMWFLSIFIQIWTMNKI